MVTPTGYSYSDAAAATINYHTHLGNNTTLQSFDQQNTDQIYNTLSSGMEMIGFQTKNLQQLEMWKGNNFTNNKLSNHNHGGLGLGPGPGPGSSSSKVMLNELLSGTEFYHHHHPISDTTSENSAWNDHHQQHRLLVDDPSLRCIFPCEGNEKPSQGLSLSLSSSNPSSIGLQSFELRQQHEGFFSKSVNFQNQKQIMQDGFLGKSANLQYQNQFQIGNSKYLVYAQELLNEFCNLGTMENDHSSKVKLQRTNHHQWKDENNASSSSSKKQSLNSLDLLELQKRKAKLLQMLEEVDRRYKNYSNQMKAVVSSFEAVAGHGAAKVYSSLASKAMSRHFRCLRDGIVDEIKTTKKSMGEKDIVSPAGSTRGETPRLRILDQTLRQQRAFQQMNMMESHPWRPLRGLPERSVSVLRAWLFEHFLHPYPSDVDKHILARQTGLSRSQVSNWFINARVRLWKPMVEEMYIEEMKEQENAESLDVHGGAANLDDDNENVANQNQTSQTHNEDKKPTLDQLVRIDSECLSSIINNQEKIDGKSSKSIQEEQHHDFSLGAMEMDFSGYNHNSANAIHFGIGNPHQGYGGGGVGHGGGGNRGGGGGVSLTLGLQQHGGSGVSLAFSSASQNSLFYTRDHIEDCQPIQYSLLDNEGQDLQYRNLMGTQILHDLG